MKVIAALCLLAVSLAYEDALSLILKSPKATLKLYGDFKAKENLRFGVGEDRMRYRLFRKNAEFVAASNQAQDGATYGLNFFSALTEEEKRQYLGLNVTDRIAGAEAPLTLSVSSVPDSKLWTNEDSVSAVKNQGGCGSCWTFAAVGGLETRYKVKSGRLRSFAEQEFLDCVYPPPKDGCNGGWPDNAYIYSKNAGGRLAATADYPYKASDGSCMASSTPNSLKAFKITGYQLATVGESGNIEALATGSLSMAFEVTGKFQQYQGGILKDNTCTGRINHGVTGVGYTSHYVLVKNSWGPGWGDHGFVKFSRNWDNCDLFQYSSFPVLSSTGSSDSGADDKATDYHASDDDDGPTPVPDDCKDVLSNCKADRDCLFDIFAQDCKLTCKLCCPRGTTKCPDGECRHVHMC